MKYNGRKIRERTREDSQKESGRSATTTATTITKCFHCIIKSVAKMSRTRTIFYKLNRLASIRASNRITISVEKECFKNVLAAFPNKVKPSCANQPAKWRQFSTGLNSHTQSKSEKDNINKEAEPDSSKEKEESEKMDPFARFPDDKNPATGEIGGPTGPEPTRYGDWERKGRVTDF